MEHNDRLRLDSGWVMAGVVAVVVGLVLIMGWLVYTVISWEPAYPV